MPWRRLGKISKGTLLWTHYTCYLIFDLKAIFINCNNPIRGFLSPFVHVSDLESVFSLAQEKQGLADESHLQLVTRTRPGHLKLLMALSSCIPSRHTMEISNPRMYRSRTKKNRGKKIGKPRKPIQSFSSDLCSNASNSKPHDLGNKMPTLMLVTLPMLPGPLLSIAIL